LDIDNCGFRCSDRGDFNNMNVGAGKYIHTMKLPIQHGPAKTFNPFGGIENWFEGLEKSFGNVESNVSKSVQGIEKSLGNIGAGVSKSVSKTAHGITSSIGETFHQLDQATLGAVISTEQNVSKSIGETAHGIVESVSSAGKGISEWAGGFGKMFTDTFKWIMILIAIAIIAIIVIKVM